MSRSHLTAEFLRATLTYGLTYRDLKEMARNSLKYSFLEGAEKSRLQRDLEDRFQVFEKSFAMVK